jgi:hypothetical protein
VIATFSPPFRTDYITFLSSNQTDNPLTPAYPGIMNRHRIEGLTLDGGGGARVLVFEQIFSLAYTCYWDS